MPHPAASTVATVRSDIGELGKLLLSAAGQAALTASRLTEHFTDMSDTQRQTRLPFDLLDEFADALHSVLLVELECIDDEVRLTSGPSPMSVNARVILSAQREMAGQLAGALTRYLERGA